jgi:hypothetical protein
MYYVKLRIGNHYFNHNGVPLLFSEQGALQIQRDCPDVELVYPHEWCI